MKEYFVDYGAILWTVLISVGLVQAHKVFSNPVPISSKLAYCLAAGLVVAMARSRQR